MTSLIAKTAEVALYALAALPLIVVGVSHAQTATVKISDLNMSQPAQVQTYENRVAKAAEKVCGAYTPARDLTQTAACTSAVRAEANDKLSQVEAQQQSSAVNVASR
jgi:UrcA family protein